MKSKFIEAYLYYRNGEDVEPAEHHFVKLSEIKRIRVQNNIPNCCSFYLYKEEVYGANIGAKELVALIDECD